MGREMPKRAHRRVVGGFPFPQRAKYAYRLQAALMWVSKRRPRSSRLVPWVLCFADYITQMEVDGMHSLETLANLAEILTAIVASIAYAAYRIDQYRKMTKLEDYLKKEKADNPDKHIHTVLHLMAMLGLTEDEILRASFRSKHIRRAQHVDASTRLTDKILFAFQE